MGSRVFYLPMLSIITLVCIIVLSIIINKIATIALTLTGLSTQSARFQARSAFTGVGFTTNEAEKIVQHPVRRKIVMLLMMMGNAGIVSVIASLMLTFVDIDRQELAWYYRVLILLGSIALLWWLASSSFVEKTLNRLIKRALKKYTKLNVRDYAGLLHLHGEYEISELQLSEDHWLAGHTLKSSGVSTEGVNVLGINRANRGFIGIPDGDTMLKPGDLLIIYGRGSTIAALGKRRKGAEGDLEHKQSRRVQRQVEKRQPKKHLN